MKSQNYVKSLDQAVKGQVTSNYKQGIYSNVHIRFNALTSSTYLLRFKFELMSYDVIIIKIAAIHLRPIKVTPFQQILIFRIAPKGVDIQ